VACSVILLFLGLLPSSALPAATPAAVLRAGTSGDYPPFSVRAATGNAFTGLDIDVAERLAADLGYGLELVPFRWPDLTAVLGEGGVDIVMSGVTQRPERALDMVFTRPYAVTGAVAVVRQEDAARFPSMQALDLAEIRIAVNRGGHLEQVARQLFKAARVLAVDDNRALPGLLGSGSVEAAVSERFEARTWGERFRTLGPLSIDWKVYALPVGAAARARQVSDWLAAREADGWLEAQRQRWLGSEGTMSPAAACFEAVVSGIALRMRLMPLVAAAKRRDGLPIIDPAQRQRVLESARAQAAVVGLDPPPVADLFQLLIETAEATQQQPPAAAIPASVSLPALRDAIARTSTALIEELGRCEGWLRSASLHEQLVATASRGLAQDLSAADIGRLTLILQRIQRASPATPAASARAGACGGNVKRCTTAEASASRTRVGMSRPRSAAVASATVMRVVGWRGTNS
jgi:cyclohexadienyl dehydratase